MSGHAHGGNDFFMGGALFSSNTFCGDAGGDMSDFAEGGNDTLIASERPLRHDASSGMRRAICPTMPRGAMTL